MRTTLTLEDDVATEVQRLVRERGQSLKEVVNELLRAGVAAVRSRPKPKRARYRTPPVDVGRCLVPSLDNVGDVLEFLDAAERE